MKDRAAQIKARWKQEDIYKKRGQNAKVTADEPILTKISKHWATSGQQTNKTRLLIAKAFQANYSPPDISLEIRRYSFRGTRFDEKQRSKDKKYKAITKKIRAYKNDFTAGNMNHILEMDGRVSITHSAGNSSFDISQSIICAVYTTYLGEEDGNEEEVSQG